MVWAYFFDTAKILKHLSSGSSSKWDKLEVSDSDEDDDSIKLSKTIEECSKVEFSEDGGCEIEAGGASPQVRLIAIETSHQNSSTRLPPPWLYVSRP